MDEIIQELMITVQDLQRRLSNVLRPGRVIDTDPVRARVRVRFADADPDAGTEAFDSAWLRVLQLRAGSRSDWDFPGEGEQVMILSPGGELGAGYAGLAIYSDANPPPSDKPGLSLRRFEDGLLCSYDADAHTLTIERPEGLQLIVKATRLDFEADKVAIKNRSGAEVIRLLSEGLQSIGKSKTATMMGGQPLLPAAIELPGITSQLDTFGGGDAA